MQQSSTLLLLSLFLLSLACSGPTAPAKEATGTIQAGQFKVYYERAGQGEAVILLHAGLQDHTMWAEQVKALSAKYEVITPDLPYHGKTMGLDSTMLSAEVIRILMDSLGIERASVAGLSMGSAVALDFLIAYPARTDKVFLISAGLNGYEREHVLDSVSISWDTRFEQALKNKDTVQAAVEFTKAWAEGIYRSGDSLKAPVSQYVYATTLANLQLHKMEGWPRFQYQPPAIEGLDSIRSPVLIIDGDKDLPLIATCSDYMEKHIPDAKRVIIPGVAHMLNIEQPARVNALMLDFLQAEGKKP